MLAHEEEQPTTAAEGAPSQRASLKPLRPYQAAAYAEGQKAYRKGARAILFVAPTGSGKSRLGCEFVVQATAKAKGLGSVLWLAHREELIRQAYKTITGEGFYDVGIIAPWARRQHAAVQVASIQTLVAQLRRGRALPKARIIIADEAHHFVAEEWEEASRGITDEKGAPPLLIGLTATPERGDGKPLGKASGGLFDTLIPVSSVRELQALGVLVPCVTYGPDTQVKALVREPWQAYAEHGAGERCFCFCVTVAHAEAVAADFRAHGVPAATIHADTPWALRSARLEAFRLQDAAPLRRARSPEDVPLVLCNVQTLTEGVDVPEASVAITARGIGHGGLMRQIVGRVLRCAPGKTRAIWWDLRGQAHKPKIGWPESDCTYSLDGKAITVTEAPDDPPRKCKRCGATFMTWAVDATTGGRRCPSCGEPAPALEIPQVVEREVFAFGSGAAEKEREDALHRLAMTAADRGYRSGWVIARYEEQFHEAPKRGAVDVAMRLARDLLGIKVGDEEKEAERRALEQIAIDRGIGPGWVERKMAEKFGEDAA